MRFNVNAIKLNIDVIEIMWITLTLHAWGEV